MSVFTLFLYPHVCTGVNLPMTLASNFENKVFTTLEFFLNLIKRNIYKLYIALTFFSISMNL